MSDDYKPIKRDAESLLSFSSDFSYPEDDEDENDSRRDNRDNRNNNNNRQNDNNNRDRNFNDRNNNDQRDRNTGYNNNGGNNNRNNQQFNGQNRGYQNNGDQRNNNNPQNNNRNNNNNDQQRRNNDQNNNYHSNQLQINNNQWDNPVCKIFRNDKVYDRDDVLDLLLKKDGLVIILKDLKAAKKDPNKIQKAAYVQRLLRDIVFASAIPEALEELFGKKYDENESFSRKEIGLLMNEILIFLNGSYSSKVTTQYDEEAVDSMRRSYTDILYRYNKKKVKKLIEEIKNMSKACAKQICIITAGNNPSSSIYQLIKYLYKESGSEDFFNTSVKSLTKLFKVCFGKDEMDKVIRYIMLERTPDVTTMSSSAQEISVNLDMVIREYLESLDKNDIYAIIKDYISDRKRQDKNGVMMPRRFGDRRTIHPEDYPKTTKVLEDLERKDFSAIQYLRK